MKRWTFLIWLLLSATFVYSQKKKPGTDTVPSSTVKKVNTAPKAGPKKYDEVITEQAVTTKGLFTVHKVDDKWYFEIPDSLFNKEILTVTRFSKVAGGGSIYGGELVNQQTISWERGLTDNVLLRVVTLISFADSTNKIYTAVKNSNVNPIAQSFDIKAYGKDSNSVVIDVTDFFKGDNQVVSLNPSIKKNYNLMSLSSDRSFIETIHTFPINTEVRTTKTYISIPQTGAPSTQSVSLPASNAAGAVTFELNTSFIMLPDKPMQKRLFDPRVGYFADDYTVYGDNQQKVKDDVFIVHWNLEPKPEDMEKWKRGELVEPKKPIIYYIDPATPKQWRPYLIMGVNDWQKAFEKAGFKNAIMAKEWPENDTTMSLDDARFSVIRYFASDIENAYGPNIHDPRTGEILESHIGWYHNVMQLLHDWYFIQTAAVDPNARKMKFDDSLMGQLIRFVSSHEIGHTLGLRHNMGSSSKTPVENLRNKAWVEANGHTASIMDYARFNYVAQPEDHISEVGLFPRIGDYDKWAIQWGYSYSGAKNEKEDAKITNKWILDSLSANPRLWFGTESNPFDPRSQTEDLGDNAMIASNYGILNLKRILVNLPEWTKEEGDKYDNLDEMYTQLAIQFSRYMGHVLKNVGGIYETPKSIEQSGDVYTPTPTGLQKDAINFLNKQLFETPYWLLDKNILNKFSNPVTVDILSKIQANTMNSLLNAARLNRMVLSANRFGSANTYDVDNMLTDLKKGVWSELTSKNPIDNYRRDLQKLYVDNLINMISVTTNQELPNLPPQLAALFNTNVKNTDVSSIVRAHLSSLRSEIVSAIPGTSDKLSKYHLQDLAQRIKVALDPK
ncbi:MAG: zinc-dependent metalloprotease [Bacteroidetes bacterium]|nr:zinc-dependent metalloprotease [Bacteroidota bacterium]